MKQCAKCPWKLGTDPSEIPNGYDPAKHEALRSTIADPGRFSGDPLHIMACHETPVGAERACVGWLAHQLGPGNNIALRLAARDMKLSALDLEGPQCRSFDETLLPIGERLELLTERGGDA